MKKLFPKIIAIAMVFIMAVQISGVAMAGTYSWYDSEGNRYKATVSPKTASSRSFGVESTRHHHTVGRPTVISAGPWSVTYTGSMSFGLYGAQLTKAANNANLKVTRTENVNFDSGVTVPAGSPSGYYGIKAHVTGYSGTYDVKVTDTNSNTRTLVDGNFSYGVRSFETASGLYIFSIDD